MLKKSWNSEIRSAFCVASSWFEEPIRAPVVEMMPDRLGPEDVVEIVPVLVVEIVPALVVEIVPVFAIALTEIETIKTAL
jgi:hypothetical protein